MLISRPKQRNLPEKAWTSLAKLVTLNPQPNSLKISLKNHPNCTFHKMLKPSHPRHLTLHNKSHISTGLKQEREYYNIRKIPKRKKEEKNLDLLEISLGDRPVQTRVIVQACQETFCLF